MAEEPWTPYDYKIAELKEEIKESQPDAERAQEIKRRIVHLHEEIADLELELEGDDDTDELEAKLGHL